MDEIVYVCNRCGNTFALEDGIRLYVDGEPWTSCPSCFSTDVEEGERCKICRGIYCTYDMHGSVCKGCFDDAVSAYKSCLSSLMPWEREVLDDEYGNIDVTEG